MKSSQKNNKGIRIPRAILVGLVVVLILGVGMMGAIALKLQSLTKDTVAIVTKPSDSTQAPTTTQTETQLPVIDGTPADIDTDYDVDVEDPTLEPIYEVPQVDVNTVNILLLSSDARPGEKGGRSDSMMLMTYNRKTARSN